MIAAVVFDAGEALFNEIRLWRLWAHWLHVPDSVVFALLGATIERNEHHRLVFELLRPGFNLTAAREQRRLAGIPDCLEAGDLYPDVPACLRALHAQGLRLAVVGNQPIETGQLMRDMDLPFDFVASSAEWGVEKPSPPSSNAFRPPARICVSIR